MKQDKPPRAGHGNGRAGPPPPIRPLVAGSALLVLAVVSGPARAESPCTPCHAEQVEAASKGPHAGTAGRAAAYCEACHGKAEKHLSSGSAADIVGKAVLAKAPKSAQSLMCLSCHRAKYPGWEKSEHARSGEVTCTSCHTNAWHDPKGKAVAKRGAEACARCHEDEVVSFKRVYRHPVLEGKMSCASCHDVHGATAKGPKSPQESCLECHREVSGPYVFPHRALEDGCSSCHTPHGSVNRGLLTTAGNGMCLTCHLQSSFPAVGNVPHNRLLQGGGKCLDCHSEVHGSNVDELMAPRYRRK